MEQQYNVSNKSAGRVVYSIPELRIRRDFNIGETKKIALSELNALSMRPGGKALLYNYLYVQDANAIENILNEEVAPEYFLTTEQIPTWIVSCSLDEFKDALDFAPEGTKDLIKQTAVNLRLNDMNKRAALKAQLGFDVTAVLENQQADKEDAVEVKKTISNRRTTSTIQKPENKVVISTNKE